MFRSNPIPLNFVCGSPHPLHALHPHPSPVSVNAHLNSSLRRLFSDLDSSLWRLAALSGLDSRLLRLSLTLRPDLRRLSSASPWARSATPLQRLFSGRRCSPIQCLSSDSKVSFSLFTGRDFARCCSSIGYSTFLTCCNY